MLNEFSNKNFGSYKPIVSIIMAAYNSEKTIASSIKSVLNQSYSQWELIVVNDASQDNTQFIIDHFAKEDVRIRIISNKINLGVSISRKEALNEAKGDWIAILDSDDLWRSDKLKKQVDFANKINAKIIFTGSNFIDNDGKYIDWELHVPKTLTYNELLKQNLISNSSVLVKKELYEKFYVIDDMIHEDFAMWLKITKNGIRAFGINEPLLIYRLSEKSRSSNKIKSAIMRWNTYRKIGLASITAFISMCWYVISGINKYKHLKYETKLFR